MPDQVLAMLYRTFVHQLLDKFIERLEELGALELAQEVHDMNKRLREIAFSNLTERS